MTKRYSVSQDCCSCFSHVYGASNTFPLERQKTGDTVTGMLSGMDEPSRAYMQSLMDDVVRSRTAAVREREERERERRQEIRAVLIDNGMDANASSSEQAEFEDRYRRMAKSDAEAYFEMGEAFYYGKSGAVQDRRQAFRCYDTAVYKGCLRAAYSLGYCYYKGIGVSQNGDRAKKWLKVAAENGNSAARELLPKIRQLDRMDSSATADEKREFTDLVEKALDDDANAQYQLAVAFALGRSGAMRDIELSNEWYVKAADAGVVDAMVELAGKYKCGDVSGKDVEDAIALYEKAAWAGNLHAQEALIELYSTGEHVAVNYHQALKWALLASENDCSNYVFCLLGKCYEQGLGVDEDISQAISYYQKAAQGYNVEARAAVNRLKKIYGHEALYGEVKFGPSVSVADRNECRRVYDAAQRGEVGAEYEMGNILSMGMFGVFVDKKEAFEWYLKAAEHGFAEAQYGAPSKAWLNL